MRIMFMRVILLLEAALALLVGAEPSSNSSLARIKRAAKGIAVLFISESVWFLASAFLLNDFPNVGLAGMSLSLCYVCGVIFVIEVRATGTDMQHGFRRTRHVVMVLALGTSVAASVELLARGIGRLGWPPSNDWRALLMSISVAVGVTVATALAGRR